MTRFLSKVKRAHTKRVKRNAKVEAESGSADVGTETETETGIAHGVERSAVGVGAGKHELSHFCTSESSTLSVSVSVGVGDDVDDGHRPVHAIVTGERRRVAPRRRHQRKLKRGRSSKS